MPLLEKLFFEVDAVVLLACVALLLAQRYLYAPLRARRKGVAPIEAEFVPIELPDLPPDLSQAFSRGAQGLAACGFVALGHVTRRVANTRQDGFVSSWANHSLRDRAGIVGVLTPSRNSRVRVASLITFGTEFSGGTSIVTTNRATPSCFPRDPLVSSVRCPGVDDIALLYRFHRARVERYRAGRSATMEGAQDVPARMRAEQQKTYQRLVAAGYYSIDAARQCYVPTYKGAYLMTYRLLFPFRQIQRLRRNRSANRTLRELGFGGLAAFRRSQSQGTETGA